LDDRKQRGKGQVWESEDSQINFHFEGRKLRTTQQKDDAEACEIEEEDKEGRCKNGCTKDREDGIPPDVERVRAEGARGSFKLRIKTGESIANDADDDGCVVENMRDEDGSEVPMKLKEERGKRV